ncbi:unnamed protein product [Rhizophagus irregularis]|nr:unnamed protein product [Rhizophagus irregularis]
MSSNADNSTSALNTITDVANSSTPTGKITGKAYQEESIGKQDICYFMCGDDCGKYTDIGERYFEEFNTLFWHRPVSMIQNVQRTNVSIHRRRNRDNVR